MAPTTPKSKKKLKEELAAVTEEDRQPGVVYIGHVPHGFFETELKKYFSQFGRVLNIKLSRSKKSGKSKGYAFVKFQYAAVAKTVANTCQNYLFFDKLLKCEYRKLEDVHPNTFFSFKWKPNTKPKRLHNAPKSATKAKLLSSRAKKRQTKKIEKLKSFGVDLDLSDIVTKGRKIPKPDNTTNSSEEISMTLETQTKDIAALPKLTPKSVSKNIIKTPKSKMEVDIENTVAHTPKSKSKKESKTHLEENLNIETPKSKSKKESKTPKEENPIIETPKSKSKKERKTPKKENQITETPKSKSKKDIKTPQSTIKEKDNLAVTKPKSDSKKAGKTPQTDRENAVASKSSSKKVNLTPQSKINTGKEIPVSEKPKSLTKKITSPQSKIETEKEISPANTPKSSRKRNRSDTRYVVETEEITPVAKTRKTVKTPDSITKRKSLRNSK